MDDIDSFYIALRHLDHNLRKRYPPIVSADDLAQKHRPAANEPTCSLDLGCGSEPRNPFGANHVFGVDVRSDLQDTIRQADLETEDIPFESNSVDFCTAFDFLEHVPRTSWAGGIKRMAFLELMNEIHRVLKPGGLLLHSTPAYPAKEVFQDPTHVNVITEDTLPIYFCQPRLLAKTLGYGFNGCFELVEQGWVGNAWVVGIMKAIK